MNLLSHAKAYTCCACILAVRGGIEMKYTLQSKYMLSRVTQQDTRCKSNIKDDKASLTKHQQAHRINLVNGMCA